MSETKFTKGPWRWEINNSSKTIELCGSGIEVLRFKRWGMSSATPTFTKQDDVFLLQGEHPSNLRANIEGRGHHSDWCQTIDHPDAHLIAAAPEMYKEIESDLADLVCELEYCEPSYEHQIEKLKSKINRKSALLAKARGEQQ